MSIELLVAHDEISGYMDKIKKLFKCPNKIAVIVIPEHYKTVGDTDFLMTDATLDELISVIERRKKEDKCPPPNPQ